MNQELKLREISRAMKSVVPLMMVMVLLAQDRGMAQSTAQTCSASLSTLNACAPFVVPGTASNPSASCCGALQRVDHDCLCRTLRITARIPAQCNLAPLTCGN